MDLREVKEFFNDAFKYIIVIGIALVIFIYVFSFQQIFGNSMSPTLKDKEIAVISKISVKLFEIERNDIVSLESKDGKVYVKRIIGLPGEEIHYMNNILYINNEGFTENRLAANVKTNNFMFEDICSKEDCPDGVIPKDMYLVLGDNRTDSLDSRDSSLGLVHKDQILGKTILKIWPLSEFGKIK